MLLITVACVCFTIAAAQDQVISPKTVTRELPANVLITAPELCFASTQNKTYAENQSWSLTPICGRATCLKGPSGLIERVEDCGESPKDSPGCQYINQDDSQKEFPNCCPKYSCEPGSQLLYPTEEEVKAAAQQADQASEAPGQEEAPPQPSN